MKARPKFVIWLSIVNRTTVLGDVYRGATYGLLKRITPATLPLPCEML